MRIKNNITLLCIFSGSSLCLARGTEDQIEISDQIVTFRFSSSPEGVLLPKPPLPEPEKLLRFDVDYMAANACHGDDIFCRSKFYSHRVMKRHNTAGFNLENSRPPKKILPKKSARQKHSTSVHRR